MSFPGPPPIATPRGGTGTSGGSSGASTASPGWSNISGAPAVTSPTMGGLIQLDPTTGELSVWTGGKPKVDWTGLVDPGITPTPHMFRSVGSKDAKGYAYRIKGMETKFGIKDDLRAFCRHVLKHFRQCGLDTVTYLPDPAEPTEMESVVATPNKFTKAYINTVLTSFEAKYDKYDRLNSSTAIDFVTASLTPELERKVTESLVTTSNPSFILVWMTLVEKIRLLSVARFDILEKRIKARKPTDYPGQNLDTMAEANIRDLIDLQQGGWYSTSTGVTMVENFASANTECFEFKSFAYEIVKNYKKAVKECFHMNSDDSAAHMKKLGFDFETICVEFGEYYRSANQDGKWLPTRNMRDTKAPPSNFSHLAMSNRSSKAYNLIQTKSGTTASGTTTTGTCHNCGKEGHWARNCPIKGKTSGNKGSSDKSTRGSGTGSTTSWTRIPPPQNSLEQKTMHGKTFHWCGKCKRWTTSHGTDQHVSKVESGSSTKTEGDKETKETKQVNFGMVEDFAAWHCHVCQSTTETNTAIVKTFCREIWNAFIVATLVTFGVPCMVVAFTHLLTLLTVLGVGIVAPISWIVSFIFFLGYQPILAKPPPAPAEPKLNRRCRRYINKRFDTPPIKSGFTSNNGFHRSYPLRLRSHGIYRRTTSSTLSDVLTNQTLCRCWSNEVGQFHPANKSKGTQPPLKHPPTSIHSSNKGKDIFDLKAFGRMVHKNKLEQEHIDHIFQNLSFAQKRAVSSIRNEVLMYRPDLRSKFHNKFLTMSVFVAEQGDIASEPSPLLHKLTQFAPAWFGSKSCKTPILQSIIWDSGASVSISYDRSDFVGPITTPTITTLNGVNKGVQVTGEGFVAWPMQDVQGMLRTIKVPALLVPQVKQRLLSTSSLLQHYPGESIKLTDDKAILSGFPADNRGGVEAPIDRCNNLPTTHMYDYNTARHIAHEAHTLVTTVSEHNINLTEPEKELLRWHQRLCHLDFKKIKFLFRTGILSRGETNRHLHTMAAKLTTHPKCAACQFGKQFQRSVPSTTTAKVSDKVGAISSKSILPGQQISVDHFVCKTKGRLFTSRGKTDSSNMYSGGCVFVDHFSGLIHVEMQHNLNTHETLKAKNNFEAMARDHGVIPQSYLSDNGPAFASHEFGKNLMKFEQVAKFAGAGAHHQNGIAERSIRTVISIARTMMLHAAIHWPDVSDPSLWPMAVQHAAFVFNRMPHFETGLCPLDLFNRQRWKQSQLHDLHVWGCPVYVLDKKIADGIKIPKWAPRSNRFIYMGTSPKHALSVPLLLNPESGVISPQFHIVFDDWFATISATTDQLPDFNSEQWQKMFGDSQYQYVVDDDDENQEPLPSDPTIDAQSRLNRVEEAMERVNPPVPLPVPELPLKPPPEHTTSIESPSIPSENVGEAEKEHYASERSTDLIAPSIPSHDEPPQQREPTSIPSTPMPITSAVKPKRIDENEKVLSSTSKPSPRGGSTDYSIQEPQMTQTVTKKAEPQFDRPRRNIVRPKRYNNWYETMSYTAQHPYTEHNQENTHPTLNYLSNILLCTTPPIASGSDIVSMDAFKASVGDPDTLSYDEAMSDKESVDEWRSAARKEIETLEQHGTWEIDLIENAKSKVLPGTWVFRIKRSPDGSIIKRKARYCVRGDLQEGERETFAPVVAWSTVRLFLVLSSLMNWDTSAIDFSSAFVQATLQEPTWIHLPRGFQSSDGQKKCLRLKKSLYGLSQAPRLWYLHLFDAMIKKLHFVQSKFDSCLLYNKNLMVIIFVDDCGISYQSKSDYDKLITDLRKLGFELTEEGSFIKFLGIQFDRTATSTTMTQTGLIGRIIEATGMSSSNPNHTPTSQDALGSDPTGLPMKDTWNYRSIIGMLLYLSTNTRPDIAFAVSQAARFSNNPKQSHATAVKTIVRYLLGTKDKGTVVTPTGKLDLKLYVDADFAGLYKREPDTDPNSARSRTGYILILGGFPLIWKSHLQTEISLSTLEAEYSALSSSMRALIPIRELLFELVDTLKVSQTLITSISCSVFEDNQGAFLLGTNHRITNRTKYFLVKYHHFWVYIDMEDTNKRKILLFKIGTENQRADFLTKGLFRVLFQNNRFAVLGF